MATATFDADIQRANKEANGQAWIINQIVLANIPGLDVNQVPPRDEQLPDAANIVETTQVFQSSYVNPNMVVYSMFEDTTKGDYAFNWIGLVDEDGFLILVDYVPERTKVRTQNGVQGNNLTHNFFFAFDSAQAVTEINVPAQSWQLDFTEQFRQIDERQRLDNQRLYGTLTSFANGLSVTYDQQLVTVSTGLIYVKGLPFFVPLALDIATQSDDVEVFADVYFDTVNDGREIFGTVRVNGDSQDYVDSANRQHYVVKLADIVSGVVTESPRFNVQNASIVNEFEAQINQVSLLVAQNTQSIDNLAQQAIVTDQDLSNLQQQVNSNVIGLGSLGTQVNQIDQDLQTAQANIAQNQTVSSRVEAETDYLKEQVDQFNNLVNPSDLFLAIRRVAYEIPVATANGNDYEVTVRDLIPGQPFLVRFESTNLVGLPNLTVNGGTTKPLGYNLNNTLNQLSSTSSGTINPTGPCWVFETDNRFIVNQFHRKLPVQVVNVSSSTAVLSVGQFYVVTVHGVTQDRGGGDHPFAGARVLDSNGNEIQAQPGLVIDWHNGQAPYSATFIILGSRNGVIQGEIDGQPCLHITAFSINNL